MKQRKTTRILSFMLALMLCIPLCLSVMSKNQAVAATADGPVGIFALRLEKKSEYFLYSAFLLYDDVTDRQYILADPSVADYAAEGFSIKLLAPGYEIDATCLGDDGYFAYLGASGMNHFRPLLLSESYSEQIYIFVQSTDEKQLTAAGEVFQYCDLRSWEKEGDVYIAPDKFFNEIMGAPAVKDMSTYEVVGTMGYYDGQVAYYPAEAYNFGPVYSVEHQDGSRPVSSDDGDADEGGVSLHPALLVGIAVLAVFAVISVNQKKKTSAAAAAHQSAPAQNTTPVINQDFAPLGGPTSPAAQWQVRGMGGAMDGKVFLLTGTLRFGRSPQSDVVFSSNTPGISGNHCQVSIEHGAVVLRDLQSTYGTYMGGRKLEPQISYNLQNGDSFTLAESGQTFRLERSGNAVRDMTPAVRSNADGRTYRADMNGCISFGRDPRSQVPFPGNDSSVSTNHCILYREGGKLYLKDTNSTNGTFFDEKNRLKPGKPYPVKRGMTFFLVSPKNSFVITED